MYLSALKEKRTGYTIADVIQPQLLSLRSSKGCFSLTFFDGSRLDLEFPSEEAKGCGGVYAIVTADPTGVTERGWEADLAPFLKRQLSCTQTKRYTTLF